MTNASPQESQPSKPACPCCCGRRVWIGALIILALAGAIFTWAWIRRPTGPAEGTGLNDTSQITSPPTDDFPTLSVATFNMASGVGKDDRKDLDRTAAEAKGYDVVGLEEVGSIAWPDGGAGILKPIAKAVGRAWLFAPTETRLFCESFGNGILSDLPVSHWKRVPTSSPDSDSNRNLLLVDATWHGKPIHFLITHLDRHNDHDRELGKVIDQFLTLPTPAILLADLNTTSADPQWKQLDQTPGVTNALRQVVGDAIATDDVDWIFVRGLTVRDAGFADNGASDHHIAWAKLAETGGATTR